MLKSSIPNVNYTDSIIEPIKEVIMKRVISWIGSVIVNLLSALKIINWESVVVWILRLAAKFLVGEVKKTGMTYRAILFTQWIQIGAVTLGAELSHDTSTPIDDKLVEDIDVTAQQLADIYGFELHIPGDVNWTGGTA